MTEPYNPFGAVAENDPVPDEQEDAGSRRNLVALGGLAAVLLAGGAYFLLSGGEEVTDTTAASSAPRAATPAVLAPPKAVKLPVATQVQLGRNPFRALYVQPPPAPPAPPVTPTDTTPVLVGGGLGGTGSGGTVAPPSSGGSAPPAPVQPAPAKPAEKVYRLVLTRVYGDSGKDLTAVFTIDGKQQTARVGSTFGPTAEIKLLSLQEGPKAAQWTAVLQVGDGDPFDIVTGEPAFVR